MPDENNEPRMQWICGTLDVEGGMRPAPFPTKPIRMGLAAKNNLWKPGTVLKVRFLQGETDLHERVMTAASEWFVDGVKLSLAMAERGERAQIRIAFDKNQGSWSYVGRDVLGIHPSQPTMNLGWANMKTPKRDFWSVVIHEFGHTLGLLHEHNHPQARIKWNKDAVYAELGEPPNSWDRATIDSNVFEEFDKSEVITTDFDEASVMIYPIPANWTQDGKSFIPSWKLSSGDAATIRKLYA